MTSANFEVLTSCMTAFEVPNVSKLSAYSELCQCVQKPEPHWTADGIGLSCHGTRLIRMPIEALDEPTSLVQPREVEIRGGLSFNVCAVPDAVRIE